MSMTAYEIFEERKRQDARDHKIAVSALQERYKGLGATAFLDACEASGLTVTECCLCGEDADATIVNEKTGASINVSL